MADAIDRPDPQATLARWRQQGDHLHDTVHFHFLEALARRTAAHEGEARRVLDARLAQALKVHGERLAEARRRDRPEPVAMAPAAPGALADLLRCFATPADTAAPAELKAVRVHGRTWSRLSAEQRLLLARATVPGNAGPLHSHALMLRALTLMHEISPDYLSHFMRHVDSLLWLDQARGSEPPAAREAPRTTRTRARPAGKA